VAIVEQTAKTRAADNVATCSMVIRRTYPHIDQLATNTPMEPLGQIMIDELFDQVRIRKRARREGRDVMAWVPLRKSVTLLFRYREISARTRYLEALSQVHDPTLAVRDLRRYVFRLTELTNSSSSLTSYDRVPESCSVRASVNSALIFDCRSIASLSDVGTTSSRGARAARSGGSRKPEHAWAYVRIFDTVA
jgi:hypothetical protein